MTEQKRVDKLKARMNRWQAYVDKPQGSTPLHPEKPDPTRHKWTPRKVEVVQPDLVPEPVRGTANGWENSVSPDMLIDIQEARIADLQTVLAREREQTNRLADEVQRAHTLHAATLYSHIADEKTHHAEPRLPMLEIPEMEPVNYDSVRRKNLATVFGLLLAITSVLVLAFLLTR